MRQVVENRTESTNQHRGQTNIDFLFGSILFLLTTGFVISAVPGMLDPFSGPQEHGVVADRIASQLTRDFLREPDSPGVLNETCTYAFFNETVVNGDECPFDATNPDLTDRIGVSSRYGINITIERNVSGDATPDVLCSDTTSIGPCPSTLRLSSGGSPPPSRSVFSAQRRVLLDGRDVRLVVRVW